MEECCTAAAKVADQQGGPTKGMNTAENRGMTRVTSNRIILRSSSQQPGDEFR
jgi:hypothetical protein